MKSKKCKVCGDLFVPTQPLQMVCSAKCAYEYQKKQRKDKIKTDWRNKKKALKKTLQTKSEVEKILQKEINTIVRLLDKGHECISSGRSLGKSYDAGHLYTTKANPTIRFHLMNIFAQSVHDNQHLSGNELQYFIRLKEVFGEDVQEEILKLKQIPPLHLTKEDVRDVIPIARGIIKWLKLQNRKFTLEERISLRREFNKKLGIYGK